MLRSRIIPCLLIHNGGLVKTIKFSDPKYVGDPINAVKIFNEKQVDELIVIDIDATVKGLEPNYQLIKNIATECRMPLCYGGGVTSVDQAKKILSLGVEKIALSSSIIERAELVSDISEQVGSQSVVAVLDLKKQKLMGGYDIFTHNGKKKAKCKFPEFINTLQRYGVGEILLNSIDRDGSMSGYDQKLIAEAVVHVKVPLTILGGAGSVVDIQELIDKYKILGVAAGSLFVFKGKYRAVLINYPSELKKRK